MMEVAIHPGLALLQRLMSVAGWHCGPRNLTEAAPHLARDLSPDDLVATLKNLHIPLSFAQARQTEVLKTDCPALFVDPAGEVTALLDASGDKLLVCAPGGEPAWVQAGNTRGTLIKIERFTQGEQAVNHEDFSKITRGFRGLIPWLVVASFMANLMGLATPLMIMMVYDRVIPTGSTNLVISLSLAAVLILAADAGFRFARSSAVAYMGRVVEHRLGLALFRKLMALPMEQISRSEVEQQISRFKQFEGLRDVFSGQILTTLLDLPFILIFLGLIFYLSPQVGFLVMGLVVIFALTIWITLPLQQGFNTRAAAAKAQLQKTMFETVNHQRDIQRLGLGDVWMERYGAVAQDAAAESQLAKRFQMVSQNFGQTLMMIAGVGAIVLSTLSAMQGDMSFGALIAVMALVWKVLTPLQSLYSNAPQIVGFLRSKRQVDRVLGLQQEMVRGAATSHQTRFEGRVTLSGVTFRLPDMTEPVLSQVSLDVAPGEFVVIAGKNGSGKTKLFEMMLGLYQPLVGSVQLDGMDLRQIHVDDLRQAMSYAQKTPDVFHGTLLQNIRLAAPTVAEGDVTSMIDTLALSEEVSQFPEGLNTRLTESYRKTLPPAISKGLALVRSFVRPASVYLLNDPCAELDYMRRAAVTEHLRVLKGTSTVILISDDPEHIKIADRCVYMANGRIVANDTGENGRKKINALISANKES